MRLVIDTNILIAALTSPRGNSAALIRAIDEGRCQMLLTLPLALEYQSVSLRPQIIERTGLTFNEVSLFVDSIIALAEPVELRYSWRPQLTDPDDEMVLEAAINGFAEAIVSFNTRVFGEATMRFGIRLMQPVDVLRGLRQ